MSTRPAPPLPIRLKVAAASAVGALAVRLFGCTLRWDAEPFEAAQPYRPGGGPLLFALWHGDHFPVLYAYRRHGIYVVTSRSNDGQILTRVLTGMGYRCVRGSSSRGGTKALIDLARKVRQGHDAAIAVDGPRGPRRLAKPGIVLLAKLTGSPIVPIAGALSRCWEFRSWDRFRLPRPFARALVTGSTPIHVPPDADDAAIEAKRIELERSLNHLQTLVEQAAREGKPLPNVRASTP